MTRMYVVLKYDVSNPLTPDLYKHAPYSIVETWDDHKWDAPYYEVVDYFTNLKKLGVVSSNIRLALGWRHANGGIKNITLHTTEWRSV